MQQQAGSVTHQTGSSAMCARLVFASWVPKQCWQIHPYLDARANTQSWPLFARCGSHCVLQTQLNLCLFPGAISSCHSRYEGSVCDWFVRQALQPELALGAVDVRRGQELLRVMAPQLLIATLTCMKGISILYARFHHCSGPWVGIKM